MNLDAIIKNIKFSGESDNREILNIAHDSRKVKKELYLLQYLEKKMMGMIIFLMRSIKAQLQLLRMEDLL